MDTSIHNVISTEIKEVEPHTGGFKFWTREIVVRTKEGNTFTLTLFSPDKGGLVQKQVN